MPVQRFAPMTKDFATFDCDAHVTEPPLIWERAAEYLTRDELAALVVQRFPHLAWYGQRPSFYSVVWPERGAALGEIFEVGEQTADERRVVGRGGERFCRHGEPGEHLEPSGLLGAVDQRITPVDSDRWHGWRHRVQREAQHAVVDRGIASEVNKAGRDHIEAFDRCEDGRPGCAVVNAVLNMLARSRRDRGSDATRTTCVRAPEGAPLIARA